MSEVEELRAALASVAAECARLRSDLDVEREQGAAFVREIERLRVVEASAAIMRRVLNEVGRHAEWAGAVRDCLRDGAGSEFLARLVSAKRDLVHARQELEFDRKSSAQALDAADAEVKRLQAIADSRAQELRHVWRMVSSEPIADDDVPMVLMSVRFMVERHDSFKASAERLSAETVELRAEVKRLAEKLAQTEAAGTSWSPSIIEFTLEDETGGPDDWTCAVIADAVGGAMYGGSGKAIRMVPDVPGAYVCRAGRDGCRMYILGKLYQIATDFPMPPWVAPWLVSRFRAQIHAAEGDE